MQEDFSKLELLIDELLDPEYGYSSVERDGDGLIVCICNYKESFKIYKASLDYTEILDNADYVIADCSTHSPDFVLEKIGTYIHSYLVNKEE